MTEKKKLPKHQKHITLYHKNGKEFQFEPIDAKEILMQKDCEYSKDPEFWNKQPLEMPPLVNMDPPEFKDLKDVKKK